MGSLCPKMVGVIFPGQGSQYVGMGKDLYETSPHARRVFESAEKSLGFNITELCFSGPEPSLASTENCQPAVLTVSIACWEVLKNSAPNLNVKMTAGHSLGEFSSLVAAQSITFENAVSLVRKRGILMANSAEENPGGMIAVIGIEKEKVEEICKDTAAVANFNCPGQTVISGKTDVLVRITPRIKQAGGKAIPLSVSGAFHSPFMESAAENFAEEVKKVSISAPRVPVVSNVSADLLTTPEAVAESITRQITSPVRWEESIRRMIAEGTDTFIEVGPGKVLSKLLARIDRKVRVSRVEDKKTLEETLKGEEICF